jgi:hypothetical protein
MKTLIIVPGDEDYNESRIVERQDGVTIHICSLRLGKHSLRVGTAARIRGAVYEYCDVSEALYGASAELHDIVTLHPSDYESFLSGHIGEPRSLN